MVVHVGPELEAALRDLARRRGMEPEEAALNILKEHVAASAPLQPRDDWERELLEAARPWGVSLPDSAVSSEGLYD